MQTDDEQRLAEVHAEARTALVDGLEIKKITARLDELEAMATAWPNTPEVLEAYIMVAMSGQRRPARVNKRFSDLKKLRTQSNEVDEFSRFDAFVREQLNGLHITFHGYQTRLLGDVNDQEIYTGALAAIRQINDLGYHVFANSGTLLGITRDKKPITFDDDIDLAVVLNARSDAQAAEEFFGLYKQLKELDFEATLNNKRAPLIKLGKVSGFQVDLFPAYGVRAKYKVYPYAFGGITKFDVLPLRTCRVSGLPIPAKPEKLLAKNYGDGWITPDPHFTFPWKAQNRKFSQLRGAFRTLTE